MDKPYFLPDKYAMKKKIDRLEQQLAKANDRVKGLEQELKESEDDLDAAEQQLSSYENALEEVKAVFLDSDACPLFEPFNPRNLSAWLNKFVIEQKIEAVNKVLGSERFELENRPFDFGVRVESIEIILKNLEIELNSEQLRKEQE